MKKLKPLTKYTKNFGATNTAEHFRHFFSFVAYKKDQLVASFLSRSEWEVACLQKLINLSNYPIDQPSDKLNIVVDRVRNDLKKDSCAIIRGFLSKEGVSELIK